MNGIKLKILIVGDWHSDLHEEPVFNAFKYLGHEVLKFSWHQYFYSNKAWVRFFKKIQNRFIFGPLVRQLNQDLVDAVEESNPEVIFFYRATHISPSTIKKINKINKEIILVGYNNDDPFSDKHRFMLWNNFLKTVPLYDLMLSYRFHNIENYLSIGAKRVELLRSWFFPERNYPVILNDAEYEKYNCDIVFIGHYENDCRSEYLNELLSHGFDVRVYGPGWPRCLEFFPFLNKQQPIISLSGEEYNKALSGAKIALCFLSKLNRDTYTRRCFEIPATRTLMLSEYTDDLATLYKENDEIVFFRSKEDLLKKVDFYLKNESSRKKIADNGFSRVHTDQHDVVSRIKLVLEWIGEIKKGV